MSEGNHVNQQLELGTDEHCMVEFLDPFSE